VELAYITRRGQWYNTSWKGDLERSGGVAMNIGIHFFDMLMWLYGSVESTEMHLRDPRRMAGSLELENASIRWFLSIDAEDLPDEVKASGGHAYRSITADGEEIEMSAGFGDLHTRVYEDVLAGGGFSIDDARPAVELVYDIRKQDLADTPGDHAHPMLSKV
ncbi:MAG: Gfo/Idh/MocA family oxidoreductase, partial [Planctomycetota bacterium]